MALYLLVLVLVITLIWHLGRRTSAPAAKGGALPSPQKPKPKQSIIVGVYNIHRARGQDGVKDLNRISTIIKNADIIGLCEIQGWANLKGDHQIKLLATKLNMAGLFCPTQKRWLHFDRGNGMLSRYPIKHWNREPLQDSVGNHARSLCCADIQIDKTMVPVLITHLARRVDQIAQLKTVFDRFNQLDRAILMGDFNQAADQAHLQSLIKQSGAQDALLNTKATSEPRIDWILVKGFEILTASVEDSVASDHPYYWCQLRLVSTK